MGRTSSRLACDPQPHTPPAAEEPGSPRTAQRPDPQWPENRVRTTARLSARGGVLSAQSLLLPQPGPSVRRLAPLFIHSLSSARAPQGSLGPSPAPCTSVMMTQTLPHPRAPLRLGDRYTETTQGVTCHQGGALEAGPPRRGPHRHCQRPEKGASPAQGAAGRGRSNEKQSIPGLAGWWEPARGLGTGTNQRRQPINSVGNTECETTEETQARPPYRRRS